MPGRPIDLEKLRVALHRMNRDQLLILADRAIQLVPRAKLPALFGNLVRFRDLDPTPSGPEALLVEVRKFHEASLRGDYYEGFAVNSRNFMDKSEGTETFIAEFRRLLDKCVRSSGKKTAAPVREAFTLLFALLHRIDEGHDDVIFFADEGGSWQVGVDWRTVLPAYFRSLAASASPENFAQDVCRTIKAFASNERTRHLTEARRVANREQKAALLALPGGRTRGQHGLAELGRRQQRK